ncbi:RHS repeat-associated core domain-containing protein [Kribbella sp. NPDC056951]|uniref:RHS repeat-associated core domain-containing protein n=1 Tax=Kribbella sp. NPDC056951 TaxID=3345978 RepID=UPI00363ADC0F
MVAGCRALHFDYTLIGASKWRMSAAWLDIYNPDKTGTDKMDSIKVAAYSYDGNGRLIKVTDPRSELSTDYTYNAAGDVATVKSAGQVPFQLNYVQVGDRPKLDSVTRDRPAGDPTGGTAILGKYVYDVPLSGDGLPDLTAASVARWNQKAAPTRGFAVFGPDHPINGAPSASDWRYADLQYADAAGYTVNTATYGAGNWQYTSLDYSDQGNVVRELDERALRAVIDSAAPADQLATITVYNGDVTRDGVVVTPAGTLVTDTYGPARWAALKNGSIAWVRPHTRTFYDEGAPNGGINPTTTTPYRLETSERGSVFDPGTAQDLETVAGSVTSYNAVTAGDGDGWSLGLLTRSAVDMDLDGTISVGDQVQVRRYDSEGRSIEIRQANSANGDGNDAGTTKSAYYTATANTGFPECGDKPQWAGLPCKSYPGAAPVSPAGQPATPTIPTVTTAGYNYLLAPTSVVETSGAVTRTTTVTYLADGRVQGNATNTTGLPNSVPATNKDTTYDPATGLATVSKALNPDGTVAGTVTTAYDGWGRQISYQPAGEAATTTSYNAAGEVAQIIDTNGTTTYTYGGIDAAGVAEPRRLATRVDVATAGGTWTSTATYDLGGAITIQKLPGGVIQGTKYDQTGQVIGLEYGGPVTTTAEDGSAYVVPDGKWLAWSRDNDVNGRLAREWTPDGAAFAGPAVGDEASPYDRAYSYDTAGRLAQVRDRTGASGDDILDPTQASCVTRTYGFDANDNRLTRATAVSDSTGACVTNGATVTTRAFDTADRPTTGANGQGGYTYDALGRTLKIPSADASRPQDGDIALTYFDNDLARTITQAGTTTTYALDALDRRATETTSTGGNSIVLTRHYTDGSDNPTWITQGTVTRRYTELVGGDLSLTVDQTGAGQLTLSNQHGDIVTTVDLANSAAPAAAISGWNNYDEYGIASASNSVSTGPVRYSWLGANQRATSTGELILMGARLYNSATGLFTSADPVPGGNTNDYTYPTDPVNSFDLDGRMCLCGAGDFFGGRFGIGGPRGSGGGGRGGGSGGGGSIGRRNFPRVQSASGGYRYGLKHLNRVMDRLEKIERSAAIRAKGKIGMQRAGVTRQNTTRIRWKGRHYVPDHWRGNTIIEVKYYRPGRTLNATRQIRSMSEWAHANGHRFVIRVNYGVKLSRNLQRLANQGRVIISRY